LKKKTNVIRKIMRLWFRHKSGDGLEAKLGYRFKDPALLAHALVHRSWIAGKDIPYTENNERLEFLGDSILNMLVTEYLYKKFPDAPEGQMSKCKSAVVSGLCVGVLLISWIREQYASDVLLHIDSKNKGSAVVEMGALFDVESPAETEIRLIKSRKVLASVVLQEHLNLHAIPIGFKNRLLKKEGRMDLTLLNIPEVLRTEEQELVHQKKLSVLQQT
jgi:hypothetical protein